MQDVTITFTDGPLRGRSFEFEVGLVRIGRMPGDNGLELKGADTSVSRVHAELREDGGGVKLHNVSPNGTTVNDKIVLDSIGLQPGAVVRIGPRHPFTISWASFEDYSETTDTMPKPAKPASKGPLSSPIIRAVIVVYLVGILGLAVWLSLSGDDEAIAADDWPWLSDAYATYSSGDLSDELRAARATRAEALVQELRVIRTQGLSKDVERICREMMSIDKDSKSPLYQYGVRCLGSL